MSLQKIDHIGVAVPALAEAVEQYKLLGFRFGGTETVPEQKVNVAFFAIGQSNIELLEPTGPDSHVARFLGKRGPGVHHICIAVDDIDASLKAYKEAGVPLVDETPVIGAGGCRVAFLHPKAASGVLLELVEHKREHA